MAIAPTPEQMQRLLASPDTGPVVMLNLLKFKAVADGEPGTGAEAYGRYAAKVAPMVEALGGRFLWVGRCDQVLIGDAAEDWDAIALVEYPSRKAFIEMTTRPDYTAAHAHREHGLERTILVATSAAPDGLLPPRGQ